MSELALGLGRPMPVRNPGQASVDTEVGRIAADNSAAVRKLVAVLSGPDRTADGHNRTPDSGWSPDWGCIVQPMSPGTKASSLESGRAAERCCWKRRGPRQRLRMPNSPPSIPGRVNSNWTVEEGSGAESPNRIGVTLSLTEFGRCAGSRSTEPPAFVVAECSCAQTRLQRTLTGRGYLTSNPEPLT